MTQSEIIRRLVAMRREMLQDIALYEQYEEPGGPRQEWIDELFNIIGALKADLDSE